MTIPNPPSDEERDTEDRLTDLILLAQQLIDQAQEILMYQISDRNNNERDSLKE
ncbi:unnamed protein product [Rhizopus stolonifer]